MRIGIPKEIKNNENRIAITPAGVVSLINHGHQVIIESTAGLGSGFTDQEFEEVGAKIELNVADVWQSDMVIKVKEPLKEEFQYFHDDLILFTYLHLAPEPELTDSLIENNVTAVAYETMSLNHTLPLLTPMSEVAGRMSVQVGAQFFRET